MSATCMCSFLKWDCVDPILVVELLSEQLGSGLKVIQLP